MARSASRLPRGIFRRRNLSGSMVYGIRYEERGKDRRQSGFATLRDAEAALERERARVRREAAAPISTMTLPELHAEWTRNHVDVKLGPGTKNNYECDWRLRIEPTIGHRRIASIGRRVIAEMVAALKEAGFSNRQINKTLNTLSSMFTYAVDAQLIDDNPVRKIRRLPEARDRERPTYSLADVELVADAALTVRNAQRGAMSLAEAEWLGERDHAFILLAFHTGMRWSELAALTWTDIRSNEVAVSKALDAAGNVKPYPKNRSHRLVRLTPPARAVIETWRAYPKRSDLVFAADNGEHLHLSNWNRRIWRRSCRAAAHLHDRPELADMIFHGLRHSFISLALACRVDPQVVAKWAGHSSVTMTLDRYGHHIPGWEGDLDAFDRAMTDGQPPA